jgi:hypothetical protein
MFVNLAQKQNLLTIEVTSLHSSLDSCGDILQEIRGTSHCSSTHRNAEINSCWENAEDNTD